MPGGSTNNKSLFANVLRVYLLWMGTRALYAVTSQPLLILINHPVNEHFHFSFDACLYAAR